MSSNVQCLLCKNILSYDESCSRTLIEHIQENHPELYYIYCKRKSSSTPVGSTKTDDAATINNHTTAVNSPDNNQSAAEAVKSPPIKLPQKFSSAQPELKSKAKHKKVYVTTMEHSRKSIYKYKCPKCGAKKCPIVFNHKQNQTHNAGFASLLLKCWTLCFLPSFFPAPVKEHMKCGQCGHYLGAYNHQLQVVDFCDESTEKTKLIEDDAATINENEF